LDLEKRVQAACLKLADECLINSAHDPSDGGLAVAIAESCFSSLNRKTTGVEIELKSENLSTEALLFSESPSRIVISFAAENLEKIKEISKDCPFEIIGKVTGGDFKIKVDDSEIVSVGISELENAWTNSLEKQLES